ncbi:hypothetical protein NMG29_09345 [Streptomyces cocklensis]|uniref:Uncharacterized protein n=1 Tax=Actinacidiphila cocklensis TaxID=887465 RepID=A0A9W4DFV1_9ACTN|nr:hypothetical protein [Actinacidiphila cocklensis]MDD1058421.1 hypothetical protein [Actinacidiphila cocklensis]WSX75368.1 hypothetical protein OH826_16560 [Streptomyces sp. NBC_00899]CAG6390569.1 conserved hypothetical protein [Actinacidiphila cocklensis]
MDIHQVGPVEPPPVAPPRTTLALEWHAGWTTPVLALAELLILVLLLLHWVVRRQGGWRIARRRLGKQIRLTAGAFYEPVREFLRFRATVRQLTRLLVSTGPAEVARAALDDVDAEVTPAAPDAFGLAVAVRPPSRRSDGDVTVRLAGRGVPEALYPWETRGDDLRWHTTAAEVAERAEQTLRQAQREILGDQDTQQAAQGQDGADPDALVVPAPPRLLVPLGLDGAAAVFVDLLRGPGILSTYGDRRATRSFVQAAAAYLDLPDGGAEVVVAKGVHPRFDGPHLDEALDSLEGSVPDPARPVVVVCSAPDTDQSLRLSRMAAQGLLRALVVGSVNGHRLEVRVNSRGRVEIPGWGITTDAAPLGPAVARTARKGGSQRTKRAGGGIPPAPSGPRPPRFRPEAPTIPLPPLPTRAGRTVPSEPQATEPATYPAGTSPEPAMGGTSPAGTTARTFPAGLPEQGAEPPAPALRALFAEPEATGGTENGDPSDPRSYTSHSALSARGSSNALSPRTAETSPSSRDERQNGSEAPRHHR